MRLTPFNLIYHDLIGLNVRIAVSTDPTQIGILGNVVDETANTLTVSTTRGEKMIPKRNSRFSFYLPQEVMVDGSEISFSPDERLKRLQRRRL
jgi:ribonuclease P protein subunit POP4